jgi:hypothetical protein
LAQETDIFFYDSAGRDLVPVAGKKIRAPVILKIPHHIGRRFDPLKLPGRSTPLSDHFRPDPFPDYGPQ